jgi:hypothetical protein
MNIQSDEYSICLHLMVYIHKSYYVRTTPTDTNATQMYTNTDSNIRYRMQEFAILII